jgi:methylthioribose-1-phosphate isomerase
MKYDTIRWTKDRVEILDQRLLPARTVYVKCRTAGDIYSAIQNMKIRGAPAIGIAGAFGVYLGVRKSRAENAVSFMKDLRKAVNYLALSRPTARNLFWALERMERKAGALSGESVAKIKGALLAEAIKILEEDKNICRAIGANGRPLIKKGCRVLTHCNAGALATGAHGTALGVIFSAKGKIKRVYADETRPLLQGARLTVWELTEKGVPVTLICDNMAAAILAQKEIDVVIVGADRIAANGDTANKIGTYGLAVLAKYHKIPFYVAAPISTFDLSIPDGSGIPIEERAADEVRKIGPTRVTVKGADVRNPAFDVTPRGLITAIITERGVIGDPNAQKIREMVAKNKKGDARRQRLSNFKSLF